MRRRPPSSTLFPYPPLFRSSSSFQVTIVAERRVIRGAPGPRRRPGPEIGRAHVCTPITATSHIPSFFFNEAAPTEFYPLSLPAALPIFLLVPGDDRRGEARHSRSSRAAAKTRSGDRKSTRLHSNHGYISYSLFFF